MWTLWGRPALSHADVPQPRQEQSPSPPNPVWPEKRGVSRNGRGCGLGDRGRPRGPGLHTSLSSGHPCTWGEQPGFSGCGVWGTERVGTMHPVSTCSGGQGQVAVLRGLFGLVAFAGKFQELTQAGLEVEGGSSSVAFGGWRSRPPKAGQSGPVGVWAGRGPCRCGRTRRVPCPGMAGLSPAADAPGPPFVWRVEGQPWGWRLWLRCVLASGVASLMGTSPGVEGQRDLGWGPGRRCGGGVGRRRGGSDVPASGVWAAVACSSALPARQNRAHRRRGTVGCDRRFLVRFFNLKQSIKMKKFSSLPKSTLAGENHQALLPADSLFQIFKLRSGFRGSGGCRATGAPCGLPHWPQRGHG